MPGRQRIESEPDIKGQLSQLRQITSLYANPAIERAEIPTIYDKLKKTWWHHASNLHLNRGNNNEIAGPVAADVRDWAAFFRAQMSREELGFVLRTIFYADKTRLHNDAASETKDRFKKAKANLSFQDDEMMFFVLGPTVPRCHNALRNISSLIHCRDPAKRHQPGAVISAILAACLRRHDQSADPAAEPPIFMPEDVAAAFRDLRPGEEPGPSRRATPLPGSARPSPAPGSSRAPTPQPAPLIGTPEMPALAPRVSPAALPRRSSVLSAVDSGASDLAEPADFSMPPPPPPAPPRAAKRALSDPTYHPPRPKRARPNPNSDSDSEPESEPEPQPEPNPQPEAGRQAPAPSDDSFLSANDGFSPIIDGSPVRPRGTPTPGRDRWNQARGSRRSATQGLWPMERELAGRYESEADTDFVPLWATMCASVLTLPQPRGEWSHGTYSDMIVTLRAAARAVLSAADTFLDAQRREVI